MANINAVTPQQEVTPVEMGCPTTVHEEVCVQGTVTITPSVVVSGPIKSICLEPLKFDTCDGTPARFCSFPVSQRICVQIPLTLSALASAVGNGIVCGDPTPGECPQEPTGCTLTRGQYQTNTELTNSLIESTPDDQIVLGVEGQGFSLVVTTDGAGTTVTPAEIYGNDPLPPPAPDSPQYKQLYAQLLTANLNILNGATCPYIVGVIEDANDFLATSPLDEDEASQIQQQLALFNEGNAPGCPDHCDDDNGNGNG